MRLAQRDFATADARFPEDDSEAFRVRALVGVEVLRRAIVLQRLFEGLDAEGGRHRVRQPPRQNGPRVRVDERDQGEPQPLSSGMYVMSAAQTRFSLTTSIPPMRYGQSPWTALRPGSTWASARGSA
jgi:hypothetical protein